MLDLSKVIISADSTCDLPQELMERYNIHIIPLSVLLGDEVYMDDKLVFSTDNNYHSLVRLPLEGTASKLTVKFLATRGEETVHVFSCDVK